MTKYQTQNWRVACSVVYCSLAVAFPACTLHMEHDIVKSVVRVASDVSSHNDTHPVLTVKFTGPLGSARWASKSYKSRRLVLAAAWKAYDLKDHTNWRNDITHEVDWKTLPSFYMTSHSNNWVIIYIRLTLWATLSKISKNWPCKAHR